MLKIVLLLVSLAACAAQTCNLQTPPKAAGARRFLVGPQETTAQVQARLDAMSPEELGAVRVFHAKDAAGLKEGLPDLSGLSRLSQVVLSRSGLQGELPASAVSSYALDALVAPNNALSGLPDSLGRVFSLRQVDLRNNSITRLPDDMVRLTRLTSLDLSGNPLRSVPEWVGTLPRLTSLGIARTLVTSLPKSLGDSKLQVLRLDYSLMHEAAAVIASIPSLVTLDITVPAQLGRSTTVPVDFKARPDLLVSMPQSRCTGKVSSLYSDCFVITYAGAVERWKAGSLQGRQGALVFARDMINEAYDAFPVLAQVMLREFSSVERAMAVNDLGTAAIAGEFQLTPHFIERMKQAGLFTNKLLEERFEKLVSLGKIISRADQAAAIQELDNKEDL